MVLAIDFLFALIKIIFVVELWLREFAKNSYLQCLIYVNLRYIFLYKSTPVMEICIIIGIHFNEKEITMPYDFTYPIDDNTLFILLALRSQGEIKKYDIEFVYDNTVNYDYTYLKHDNNREDSISIMHKGLAWIEKQFGLIEKDDGAVLSVENPEKLKAFLYYYFSKFRTYKNYYHSELKHKEKFVEFIENNFEDIVEWRKKFTYDFTPNVQYKMIQYIGYLIHNKILAMPDEDENVFMFNNGEQGYKKVVNMKFTNGYDIQKFKRGRKVRGMFYILSDDNNVYFTPTGVVLDITAVDSLALLRKCIAEDLYEITVDTFRKVRAKVGKNTKIISDERLGRYISMLNCNLQDITSLKKDFFSNEHHNGVWVVDLG